MIIIDPGHGGNDLGSGNNKYFFEKDLNLKISTYQYERFKQLGISVDMTRTTDITLDFSSRIAKIQSFHLTANDILLSNYINASNGNYDGAEIIYSISKSRTLPELIGMHLGLEGQNLSSNGIYTRINNLGEDYYYIIKSSLPAQGIIIEYGFADSKGDDIYLLRFKWNNLAEAVVLAVIKYLNYPYKAPNTIIYTVKSNDTLYKISSTYHTNVNTIMLLNDLKSTTIYSGQKLFLILPLHENVIIYKVNFGDDLFTIADKFKLSKAILKTANQLPSDTLTIGQQLNITTPNFFMYNVKPGDSLYKLANDYNMTIGKIKSLNNLTSNMIFVNQKLILSSR